MEKIELLIRDLPDPGAARRFLGQLAELHPAQSERLKKKEGLLSDALTLSSFSPLLATTILQHPEYLWWLERKRRESGVRSPEELAESLARFSLTNSTLDPQVLFARFRRRELVRIYLRDIRRLATIAEITEEISNLADAILDAALKLACREMDNRFGQPQETDEKGRAIPARFCIAALGKLGSRELNYSSDIDLLFLYSNEGTTSGTGSRGQVTNREYFVKLAEYLVKLVGQQAAEGAAYRVDLRLRPHGTLGSLALSVADTVKYCGSEARAWERQVLIRSRGAAGHIELFKEFFSQAEPLVFAKDETVDSALANVRRSKEQIDLEQVDRRGYNVKLGRGGVREIEFIAQALQLAYGGRDEWLRASHTLISLSRLADRRHISESEHTDLAAAYEFLRRTEHILQMENGLQTHTIPNDKEKRAVLARRMTFTGGGDFEAELTKHTTCVSRIFSRVFGESIPDEAPPADISDIPNATERTRSHVMASLEKSDFDFEFAADGATNAVFDRLTAVSPHFAMRLAANPHLVAQLADPDSPFVKPDYAVEIIDAVESADDLGGRLSAMRQAWSRLLLEIVVRDIFGKISIREAKRLQTNLAEASIAAALRVVRDEMAHRFQDSSLQLDLAIMAVGKLGGRGVDYDSDLDLVIVYFDPKHSIAAMTAAEFYSRVVELFTTVLSSMTRDGHLYRVDLRLRPFGSKGLSAISIDAFLDYLGESAAIWEMLAFVKLRCAGGLPEIGNNVETEARRIIHERARSISISDLAADTRRVRLALEKERSRSRRTGEIDIKYGSGGMLDVYFAMRYLQLIYDVPDDAEDRSTATMLERLAAHESLSELVSPLQELRTGYEFLATLDHNLRLTVGRTTRVPVANHAALTTIASRMNVGSPNQLIEHLTLNRLAIREAFDRILTISET